jgi:ribosomal protein S18 acetylase RimI-like enzyme
LSASLPAPESTLVIRTIYSSEYEIVRQLLARCGWKRKIEDPATFQKCVTHSHIALVAEASGVVVGFLRAITDYTFNGYISMVAVEESHRGKGIGSALVRAAIGTNPNMTWVLRADRPNVSGFYRSLGFTPSAVAMEKRRAS